MTVARITKEVGADFSVADVLAWARTKPAGGRYNYCSNGNCALARFLRETGRCADPHVGATYWYDGDWRVESPIPGRLRHALHANTFGGLAFSLDPFGEIVWRISKLFGRRIAAPPATPSEWTRLDAYMADDVAIAELAREVVA